MSKDRRDSYRLRVDANRATLRSAEGFEVRIEDLSGSGVSLVVPMHLVPALQSRPSTLQLGDRSHPVRLELVRLVPSHEQGLLNVGARFHDPDADVLRNLASFLIGGFVERDHRIERLLHADRVVRWNEPRMVRRLLQLHAVGRRLPIRPHLDGTPLPISLRAERFDEEDRLIADIEGGDAGYFELGRPLTFLLAGGESVFFFESIAVKAFNAKRLLISRPVELRQAGFRVSPRPRLADDAELPITFAAPHKRAQVARRLIDVGARGLSFEGGFDDDLILPGSRIQARVELAEGEVEVTAVVRRVFRSESSSECGVEFVEFADQTSRRLWHEFVVRQSNPRLELNGARTAGKAWHILTASEYTKLWTSRRHRPHLARSFADAWFKTSDRFGQVMVANDDVRSIGTAAANLLYPKTWLIHHLGVDRSERTIRQRMEFRTLTRQLYFASMYLIHHVFATKYFVLYVEENKAWNQRMYRGFIDQYSAHSDSLYDPLQVFKVETERASSPAPEGLSYDVVEGDARGLGLLAEHLRTKLPALEVDAFDYSADALSLRKFEGECAAEGYERKRRFLFAMKNGKPIAGLIAELGSEGINLFGLLNSCRFFDLGEADPEAKRALLARATHLYREAGKKTFIFFDDTTAIDESLASIGFQHVSPGVRWLVRKDVVPAWLGYVDEMLRVCI
jgi:hypothetical protein